MAKPKYPFSPGDRVYGRYLDQYPVRGEVTNLREDADGAYFLLINDLPLVIDGQTHSVLKLTPSQIVEYYHND